MSKYTAKSVIENNFWIVEERGAKVGTLRYVDEQYVFYDNRTKESIVVSIDDFNLASNNTVTVSNATVYSYPTNTDIVYDVDLQDNVPVFKKTANSTVYFAAGYWGILFPMGWRPSFCPKLETLKNYKYIGPFKNEDDMYLSIKRNS
jgi:hypothetical protein